MICLQLTLLVLSSVTTKPHTSVSIAASTISLLCYFALAYLSYTEHIRTLRPSTLISVYLIFSIIFDGAQVRTLWLLSDSSSNDLASVFTATFTSKILLLVFEVTEKRSLLDGQYRDSPTESTSGIINRSVFWWLNSLLWRAYNLVISSDDLTRIDEELAARRLLHRLQRAWDSRELYPLRSLEHCITLSSREQEHPTPPPCLYFLLIQVVASLRYVTSSLQPWFYPRTAFPDQRNHCPRLISVFRYYEQRLWIDWCHRTHIP